MALMKFYFTPGACSIGIHILLEEIGLVFEAYPVNLIRGDQFTPEFLAINPRGSVPVLVLADGTPLTDFATIAIWLADQHPRRQLLPAADADRAALIELLRYIVNTIHGEGFTRIFTTERYAVDPLQQSAVRAEGEQIVRHSLDVVEQQIAQGVLNSAQFCIADAALFYVEFWAVKSGIALPERCRLHYQRMLQRPAVRQVLMEEGYHNTANQSAASAGESHATA